MNQRGVLAAGGKSLSHAARIAPGARNTICEECLVKAKLRLTQDQCNTCSNKKWEAGKDPWLIVDPPVTVAVYQMPNQFGNRGGTRSSANLKDAKGKKPRGHK